MSILKVSGRHMKYLFVVVAMLITLVSVLASNRIIHDLAQEERERMELWAQATGMLTDENSEANMNLVLSILEINKTIPAILCNERDSVISYVNMEVPEVGREAFFQKKIAKLKANNSPIEVDFKDGSYQYVYYDDSITLKRLLLYPYVQLSVVFVFILIAFLALLSTKKAEQNKVWVGLSKETAHQLGTPISSLIAWVEFLKMKEVDDEYIVEMKKDVNRLEVIAERFSKIGSIPEPEPLELIQLLQSSWKYLEKRISPQIKVELPTTELPVYVWMNESLFAWVIENLTKNAVDAMDGHGLLTFQVTCKEKNVYIDITDTGKGIPKSQFKSVFTPGYTTKERGWGLGLSLVKRIVESYPKGKIYVKSSEPGKGTTFRIELQRVPE